MMGSKTMGRRPPGPKAPPLGNNAAALCARASGHLPASSTTLYKLARVVNGRPWITLSTAELAEITQKLLEKYSPGGRRRRNTRKILKNYSVALKILQKYSPPCRASDRRPENTPNLLNKYARGHFSDHFHAPADKFDQISVKFGRRLTNR